MYKFFIIIFVLLSMASFYTFWSEPSQQTPYSLIYWKSDNNPQRAEQIKLFEQWLIRHHPELKRKGNNPPFSVILNSSNNQSVLIQSVSGMGGDLLDSVHARIFAPMGLLQDITEDAERRGFGAKNTYPGIVNALSYQGKQYTYPCNCVVSSFVINENTFRKYGIPIPKENWTPEEFARIGKMFVERANKGAPHKTKFIVNSASKFGTAFSLILCRSQGLDAFNETLTRTQYDDPRFIKAFQMLYDWTYKDHILPTAAESASTDVESTGYGGAEYSYFIYGNYGLILTGRFIMIRLREIKKELRFNMSSVPIPQYKYKNAMIYARATGIYAGTENPEKSRCFLEFLASKEYNDYIIKGSDGLPPNPKYCIGNPEFLSPAAYPNEGNIHANELRWAMTIALSDSDSPYLTKNGTSWFYNALGMLLANRATAADALKYAQKRYDEMIRECVKENPVLGKSYQHDRLLQQAIDRLKADWKYDKDCFPVSGSKIPANWVLNAFYQKFYKDCNMLGPAQPFPEEPDIQLKNRKKRM